MSFKPVNYYDKLPKKYQKKGTNYKNYPMVKIKLPFRMLINGTSGSSKTNTMLNIMNSINAFTRIFLYAKDLEEPLYAHLIECLEALEQQLDRKILTYSNNVDEIPSADEFDKTETNLVIFDDLVTENAKKLKPVSDLFIRGRKKNISSIFISQSYFTTPKIIRQNVNYIILKKINGKGDLRRIINENNIGISVDEVQAMYNHVIKAGQLNFFLIDLLTGEDNLKFRINFKGF